MAVKQLKSLMLNGVCVARDVETGRVSIGCGTAQAFASITFPKDSQADNGPRQSVLAPTAARAGRPAAIRGAISRSASRWEQAVLSGQQLHSIPAMRWYPAYRGRPATLRSAMRREALR